MDILHATGEGMELKHLYASVMKKGTEFSRCLECLKIQARELIEGNFQLPVHQLGEE